jgi:hypothetical protein
MALISQAYIPLENNTARLVWKVKDKLYFIDIKMKRDDEITKIEQLSKDSQLSLEVIK